MKSRMILAIALVFVLLASFATGCGGSKSVSEPSASVAQEASVPPATSESEPGEASPSATLSQTSAETAAESFPSEAPEEVKPSGAVIDAETCKAEGHNVLYGMYDFETYIQLPLTAGGDTPSYWMMMQPFTTSYKIDMAACTFFTEMEKRTGVHLDLSACSFFTASEQFNLIVSSGDIPDMMEGVGSYYSGGLTKALEDGVFVDFTNFMTEDMPNYTAWLDAFPDMRASITNLDGSIATAGTIGAGMPWNVGPQLRQDWLDELGLDTPVTYDDYYNVLKAFTTEYGGGLWLDTTGALRNNCFSSGYDVLLNGSTRPIRVMDGVVEYDPCTEDYKDYLALMNKWWTEGLIYPDFLSQAAISTPDGSMISNNEIGIWVSDADTMTTYDALSDEIVVGAAPLPRKNPDQALHVYLANGSIGDGIVISGDCKNLELAAGWLDYSYTYDGMVLNCYGVEGEGLQFDAEGNPRYTDLVLNNPNMMTIACVVAYSRYGDSGVFNIDRLMEGYDDKQRAAVRLWAEGVDDAYEYPPGVHMTTEQSDAYSQILSEIQTYVDQSTLSFIVGDMSIASDWDGYIATLESMGVKDMEALLQTVYDDYMALIK